MHNEKVFYAISDQRKAEMLMKVNILRNRERYLLLAHRILHKIKLNKASFRSMGI